jgi:hypothetical protein
MVTTYHPRQVASPFVHWSLASTVSVSPKWVCNIRYYLNFTFPQKLFDAPPFSSVWGEYTNRHTHFSGVLSLDEQDAFVSRT